jgi:hypothetical protein
MKKIRVFEMPCSRNRWATDGYRWFSWGLNVWEPCDVPSIEIWVQLSEAPFENLMA